MSGDEITAAADRLRRLFAGGALEDIYGPVSAGVPGFTLVGRCARQRSIDCLNLSKAYIAEHSAVGEGNVSDDAARAAAGRLRLSRAGRFREAYPAVEAGDGATAEFRCRQRDDERVVIAAYLAEHTAEPAAGSRTHSGG